MKTAARGTIFRFCCSMENVANTLELELDIFFLWYPGVHSPILIFAYNVYL